jgi:putative Mg2+ transporter-C (MgtC) family protein
VQATAERTPFTRAGLDELLELAAQGSRSSPPPGRGRRRSSCLALPTLNWDEALLRLALAGCARRADRLERELREREAGLRTHLLVALGSALFTIAGAYGFGGVRVRPTRDRRADRHGDRLPRRRRDHPAGLLGAGLTTAATLWVVAAVGLAAGAGYYSGA